MFVPSIKLSLLVQFVVWSIQNLRLWFIFFLHHATGHRLLVYPAFTGKGNLCIYKVIGWDPLFAITYLQTQWCFPSSKEKTKYSIIDWCFQWTIYWSESVAPQICKVFSRGVEQEKIWCDLGKQEKEKHSAWLDYSSSTEWWTFDLLVCQKLHHQTWFKPCWRQLISAMIENRVRIGLISSLTKWFPVCRCCRRHQQEFLVEFLLRTFPLRCSRDLERHFCLSWTSELWFESCPCMNAKPQPAFTNIPLPTSLLLLFCPSLSLEFTDWSGKPVAKVPGKCNCLPVTECSQPP